jgi:hypothetical protein
MANWARQLQLTLYQAQVVRRALRYDLTQVPA